MSKGRKKILITGASGFIGQALTEVLLKSGWDVRLACRQSPGMARPGAEWYPLPDLTMAFDWRQALEGANAVIHLAAMAHRPSAEGTTPEFDQVNHQATRALAQACANQDGIERFLFLSSAAVHGEPETLPLRDDSAFAPLNPYARSKRDAEIAIVETLSKASLAWAIVRPVLVYGPGNPGTMARLQGLIKKHIPIPVGVIPNRRSFLYLGNLLAAIVAYLETPQPPTGRAWILADRGTVSTELLVKEMAAALGLSPMIWRFSEQWLGALARLGDQFQRIGLPSPWNTDVFRKLLRDQFVDIHGICQDLDWTPPYSTREGIHLTFKKPI